MNGAWHCHGCMWSAFDLIEGVEGAAVQAVQHASDYCEVYRCETGHGE